jgi:hypothetical protein
MTVDVQMDAAMHFWQVGLPLTLLAQILLFPLTRFEQSETGNRLTSTWRVAQTMFKVA